MHLKQKLRSILNVFETSSPEGDYGKVAIMRDHPSGAFQLTYGRSQSPQHSSFPALLLKYLSDPKAKYVKELTRDNLADIKLVNDKEFIKYLKLAGKDPVMVIIQNRFFDQEYLEPSLRWAKKHGFNKPLSLAVIYDSFIHSGGIPMFLRRKFRAVPPSDGGNEEEWIRQYVYTRHSWLANHQRSILRKTIYRTKFFIAEFQKGNWNLNLPLYPNGVEIKELPPKAE